MELSLRGKPFDRRQGSKSQIKKHRNKTVCRWFAEGSRLKVTTSWDITGAFTGMVWSFSFCLKTFRQFTKLFSRADKRTPVWPPVLCFPALFIGGYRSLSPIESWDEISPHAVLLLSCKILRRHGAKKQNKTKINNKTHKNKSKKKFFGTQFPIGILIFG